MSTTWRTAHSNLIHVTDLELSNSTFKKVRHVFHQIIYRKKKHFYLSVNVFSTKVLIGDTIFYVSNWRRDAILRGHPSHAKV